MSKNNMLLGYARGKVGSLVFNRLKGQQITKAHNASPANPKSYAQMAQRCRYNTAVARYKMATRKFFKFAYEDKRPHESDFNAFMRHNMNVKPYSYIDFAQAGLVSPAAIKVSTGSLPSVPFSFENADLTLVNTAVYGEFDGYGLPIVSINEDLASALSFDDTVAEVSEKILAAFPFLKDGDLMTFLIYVGGFDAEYQILSKNSKFFYFGYKQFKIDTSKTDVLIQNLGKESPFIFSTEEKPYLLFDFKDEGYWNDFVSAGGLIITRKTNQGILANSVTLSLNAVGTAYYNENTLNIQAANAFASYSPTTPAILNPDK